MFHARLTLSCLAPLALTAAPSAAPTPDGPALTNLVVFGASAADAGSASILTGGFLPGPLYWQGRWSNGPTWVDRLAGLLGVPVAESYLTPGGTNYAVAGAGTGAGDSNACFGGVCAPNIGLQIDTYLAGSPVVDGDELFVLQGGGNDFLKFTGLNNATMAAFRMRAHIETLIAAGAQNFAVINLGPDNRSPIEWRTSNNAWIDQFNARQEMFLQELESEHGVSIARVDLHALKSAMIADPGAFGLIDMTHPACPSCFGGSDPIVDDPDQYYYWDGAHPTTAVHAFIAEMAADAVAVALGS